MPRGPRLDAPGTLHHVIVRGIEKGVIVRDDTDREAFVTRLGHVAILTQTSVYAWVLLPNHVHILVRSGAIGLPTFMGRLLTGHAITFNRRHGRHGHLFENRYKSIICDEDSYFQELVRYIHLNPLRAGLCVDLTELNQYPWCGHSVILGEVRHPWQDREHVLAWFGGREKDALVAYRRFVRDGLAQGRRTELVGGGLIRTLGGWAEVQAARSRGDRVLADPRILGTGPFVSAEIVAGLAAMLEWADRPEEAMPLFKKAMRLSPIAQPMWLLNMASAHIRMGQYEESIPICKAVLQKQPDQVFAHIFLVIAYVSTGREQEARAEAAEILRVNPQFSWERLARGLPRKNQDEMKRRGELLLKAGLQE